MNISLARTIRRIGKASLLFTTALMLFAGISQTWAQTQDDPIPGIDVVVRKKPSGAALTVATSNAKGEFQGKVADPGSYELHIVCGHPPCPERFTATLKVNGKAVRLAADNSYNLVVEKGMPTTLSGTVTGTEIRANGNRQLRLAR